ncbi:hypothetical protein GCM10027446_11690 [Angustibacter peucedani]
MSYIKEASSWRDRKRHRQQITLLVVLGLLVASGGIGYLVYSGVIGGPDKVDVSTLPPCPTATKKPLTPDQVVVNVYNATKRNGLASSVATTLDRRSFQIGTIANDPLHAKVTGTAVIRYGTRGTAAAQLLSSQLDGAKLSRDKRKNASVDLVLGAKYKSLKTLAQITATPSTPTCRPSTPTATTTSSPSATSTRTPSTRTTKKK